MTVLSANAALKLVKPLNERHLPAQAAVHAYAGSILTVDGDGNVGPLAVRERFAGHAVAECDNSAGAAAAEDVRVMCGDDGGPYILEVALVCTKENEGAPVYASDDATYTLDPMGASSPNVLVGKVWRYVSATHAEVQFKAMSWEDLIADGRTVGVFRDDFLGYQAMLSESGSTGRWHTVLVGTSGNEKIQIDANEHGGVLEFVIAADDEAEDTVLYFGDQLQFDINSLIKFRCRAAVVTPGTGVRVVFGMASAHNLDKDTVAEQCWFSLDAGLALKAESDDGGTENNDDKTVATLVTGVWHDYEIDFQMVADVKFFMDGAQVATATTFDMTVMTTEMQPYVSLDKASGTGTANLKLDYVEIIFWRE